MGNEQSLVDGNASGSVPGGRRRRRRRRRDNMKPPPPTSLIPPPPTSSPATPTAASPHQHQPPPTHQHPTVGNLYDEEDVDDHHHMANLYNFSKPSKAQLRRARSTGSGSAGSGSGYSGNGSGLIDSVGSWGGGTGSSHSLRSNSRTSRTSTNTSLKKSLSLPPPPPPQSQSPLSKQQSPMSINHRSSSHSSSRTPPTPTTTMKYHAPNQTVTTTTATTTTTTSSPPLNQQQQIQRTTRPKHLAQRQHNDNPIVHAVVGRQTSQIGVGYTEFDEVSSITDCFSQYTNTNDASAVGIKNASRSLTSRASGPDGGGGGATRRRNSEDRAYYPTVMEEEEDIKVPLPPPPPPPPRSTPSQRTRSSSTHSGGGSTASSSQQKKPAAISFSDDTNDSYKVVHDYSLPPPTLVETTPLPSSPHTSRPSSVSTRSKSPRPRSISATGSNLAPVSEDGHDSHKQEQKEEIGSHDHVGDNDAIKNVKVYDAQSSNFDVALSMGDDDGVDNNDVELMEAIIASQKDQDSQKQSEVAKSSAHSFASASRSASSKKPNDDKVEISTISSFGKREEQGSAALNLKKKKTPDDRFEASTMTSTTQRDCDSEGNRRNQANASTSDTSFFRVIAKSKQSARSNTNRRNSSRRSSRRSSSDSTPGAVAVSQWGTESRSKGRLTSTFAALPALIGFGVSEEDQDNANDDESQNDDENPEGTTNTRERSRRTLSRRGEAQQKKVKRWLSICGLALLVFIVLGIGIGVGVGVATRKSMKKSKGGPNNPNVDPILLFLHSRLKHLSPSTTFFEDFDDDEIVRTKSPQELALRWLAYKDQITKNYYNWDSRSNGRGFEYDDSSYVSRLEIRYSLAVLYFATNGDRWQTKRGFLSPSLHECVWRNASAVGEARPIVCDDLRLVRLDLAGNSLHGSLPEELGGLSELRSLNLHYNQIKGQIPSALSELRKLTSLDLSENYLSSTLPVEVSKLSELKELNIGNNLFDGEAPDPLRFLHKMEMLNISHNRFTGQVFANDRNNDGVNGNIFASMRNLKVLDLSYCAFSGWLVYDTVGRLSEDLKELYISANSFIGTIPTRMYAHLASLKILSASRNQFSQTIPTEVGQMRSLQQLMLSNNYISGSMPSSIGDLVNLEVLDLSMNVMTGAIPSELANCASLEKLHLNDNKITGSIPSEISRMTSLHLAAFQNSDLSGDIDFLCSALRPTDTSFFEVSADCFGDSPKINCTCCDCN